MKIILEYVKPFFCKNNKILLFLLAFFYVVIIGLFVQLIFLPEIAPEKMSNGDGLLVGYDSDNYHKIAKDQALKIKQEGWSEWRLKPKRQIVSGIASALYALLIPKPWVLLPWNGFLHAIACIAIYEIILIFRMSRKTAFFSTLVFVFIPSSLLWHIQMHNENYVIPGVSLFIAGWLSLTVIPKDFPIKTVWKPIMQIILGSFLIWITRDDVILVFHLLSLVCIFLIFAWNILKKHHDEHSKYYSHYVIILIVWGLSSPILFSKINETLFPEPVKVSWNEWDIENSKVYKEIRKEHEWQRTSWIPEILDKKFLEFATTRAIFTTKWAHSGSQIDMDVQFHSARDIVQYIPRSLQIGFLSPFPNSWFTPGYKAVGSLMRAFSGIEMLVIYIGLMGLLLSFWRYYSRIEFWLLLILTTGMIIVYACVIPNVGSLYRFRFPYLMPLVCLGFTEVKRLFLKNSVNGEARSI